MKDRLNDLSHDFRAFALSGNVIDLAIGVIVGMAFQKVVDSFAEDIVTQVIASVISVPDFSDLAIGAVKYGAFINTLLSFMIIAFTLLFVVKGLMRLGMNFRAQGNRECDYCKEFIPVDASRCKFCTSDVVPQVTD